MIINLFINLIYGMYMVKANPFKDKSLNMQDLFNEIIVSASLYWKIFYTGIFQN